VFVEEIFTPYGLTYSLCNSLICTATDEW